MLELVEIESQRIYSISKTRLISTRALSDQLHADFHLFVDFFSQTHLQSLDIDVSCIIGLFERRPDYQSSFDFLDSSYFFSELSGQKLKFSRPRLNRPTIFTDLIFSFLKICPFSN
jgi:hypothetical protein